MAKDLKGSKTEKNLQEAFAGESMARNKYDYYAARAKKDGYEQIAAFFADSAQNEREHAKIWFKLLHGGGVPPTAENLQDGINGEEYEYKDMYARFEKEARAEGFTEIADLFKGVADIEKVHAERYIKLLQSLKAGTVFKKAKEIIWACRNCGHVVSAAAAPAECPVCVHPQSYFEEKQNNY
ncbi:MAG: rubrerythrin family protein [Firmicutes bacterium]|nr:rubrerythrin family protein [Bacillota bacterium]